MAIAKAAGTCLCANVGSSGGCTVSELADVQKVTNEICSSALAASSKTYTPKTAGANYCATVGGGGGGASSTTGSASGPYGSGWFEDDWDGVYEQWECWCGLDRCVFFFDWRSFYADEDGGVGSGARFGWIGRGCALNLWSRPWRC